MVDFIRDEECSSRIRRILPWSRGHVGLSDVFQPFSQSLMVRSSLRNFSMDLNARAADSVNVNLRSFRSGTLQVAALINLSVRLASSSPAYDCASSQIRRRRQSGKPVAKFDIGNLRSGTALRPLAKQLPLSPG